MAARREAAARKKEAARLAAEQKRRQIEHDALSREISMAQLTAQRREKEWRKMLSNIATPQLREDVLYTWHNFERVVDVKDFMISILMDEVNNAEEHYLMNFRSHSESIDNLITKFRDQLDAMKEDNEMTLATLQATAEKDIENLKKRSEEAEEYFKTMLFGLEAASREQEQLVRGDYLSKIDEETSKYGDILQNLRAGIEKKYSDVWEKIKAFLHQFNLQKEDTSKAYNILIAQDDAVHVLCSQQHIKLETMQEYLKKLKHQFNNLQQSQTVKISDLEDELKYFSDAFFTLKGRFDKGRIVDKENMATLTVASNEAMDELKSLAKKGQQLLEMTAICRRLETLEEKILPFPMVPPDTSPEEAIPSPNIKFEEYKNTQNLQLFWQRVAQADAVRHSINEEREALKRENRALKEKIHKYCQCLECPSLDLPKIKSKNVVDGYMVHKMYNPKH